MSLTAAKDKSAICSTPSATNCQLFPTASQYSEPVSRASLATWGCVATRGTSPLTRADWRSDACRWRWPEVRPPRFWAACTFSHLGSGKAAAVLCSCARLMKRLKSTRPKANVASHIRTCRPVSYCSSISETICLARFTRLFTVPTAQLQITAASSYLSPSITTKISISRN